MKDMIYSQCSQGWYIGITAASQAVKAGSTPVPCSKKVHDFRRGLFLASTRRSASRLDSNYLTVEVNSAYCNSPLRCELTRDFARGSRGTLKCSGEVNSPCANAFAQQKHFTAQKRRDLRHEDSEENHLRRGACIRLRGGYH